MQEEAKSQERLGALKMFTNRLSHFRFGTNETNPMMDSFDFGDVGQEVAMTRPRLASISTLSQN